jgi:hypothetical protein
MITDIVSIGEMSCEQSLNKAIRPTVSRGIPHHPVGIDRGRGPPYSIEPEVQPLLPTGLAYRCVESPGAVLAAEFAHYVVGPGHPDARHIGVEQERPPYKLARDIRAPAQSSQ